MVEVHQMKSHSKSSLSFPLKSLKKTTYQNFFLTGFEKSRNYLTRADYEVGNSSSA